MSLLMANQTLVRANCNNLYHRKAHYEARPLLGNSFTIPLWEQGAWPMSVFRLLRYSYFTLSSCFIQPTAHFGALVFGSDIDGRQMRGKGAGFYDSEHTLYLTL